MGTVMNASKTKINLINLAIVVAIIGILVSIMIPSYCDYMPRAKWAKAIASVSELKSAIGSCLLANPKNMQVCNNVNQLSQYGIKSMPVLDNNGTKVEISTDRNLYPLGIIISGNKDLEGCQFAFIPTIDSAKSVGWQSVFIGSTDASEQKCLSRVKGAKNLAQFKP